MLLLIPVLGQYGRRFAIGEIMAKALSHHLRLVDESVQTTCSFDVDAGWETKRHPRHDYFPCVYNDAFVQVVDDSAVTDLGGDSVAVSA